MRNGTLGTRLDIPRQAEEAIRLSEEWPKRSKKIQEEFLIQAARYTLYEMLERIPKGEDPERYKKALRISRIRSSAPAVAITVSMTARRVRKLDAPKTLLYVKRKKTLKRTPPGVEILERYGPWTLDTIPFQPDAKDALTVSMKVSEREVQRVAKERLRDKSSWRAELDKIGIREVKKVKGQAGIKVKAIPDVALVGLRLEFGIGHKPKPHWRPAIRKLQTVGVHKIAHSRTMTNALMKLRYRDWRRWPTKRGVARAKISLREVARFVAFQKRLGFGH